MMMKCWNCGHVFDSTEAITIRENMGEFWGAPAYEDWNGCPKCRQTDLAEVEEQKEGDDS